MIDYSEIKRFFTGCIENMFLPNPFISRLVSSELQSDETSVSLRMCFSPVFYLSWSWSGMYLSSTQPEVPLLTSCSRPSCPWWTTPPAPSLTGGVLRWRTPWSAQVETELCPVATWVWNDTSYSSTKQCFLTSVNWTSCKFVKHYTEELSFILFNVYFCTYFGENGTYIFQFNINFT